MKLWLVIAFCSLFLIIYSGWQYLDFNDGKLHVVVCDVGQGDAIFIKTPEGKTILFDGGPDKSVLSCLSNNLPLWERRIDLMILSHPHSDHLNGLIDVLKVYKIGRFATEKLSNDTTGYNALLDVLKGQRISTSFLTTGDVISTSDGLKLTILSPSQKYLDATADSKGMIRESGEFASLILHLKYKNFDMLLTGDTQSFQLAEAVKGKKVGLEVLQVPHHGSRTGLTEVILDVIQPEMAVISVGKNSYGHPAPFTLNLLSKEGIKIERTDKRGQIVIVSNGSSYSIK